MTMVRSSGSPSVGKRARRSASGTGFGRMAANRPRSGFDRRGGVRGVVCPDPRAAPLGCDASALIVLIHFPFRAVAAAGSATVVWRRTVLGASG